MREKMNWFHLFLVMNLFLFLCISTAVTAQSFPEFKIRTTNGKVVSSGQISINKPTIIIVFSPDCSHCQVLMDGIFKKINHFKNTNIIMATFVHPKEIIAFEKKYQTTKYSNVTVGTDEPVFFLQKYYQLTNTPFTVLYDKNRKFVASYKKEVITDDLIRMLEKLR